MKTRVIIVNVCHLQIGEMEMPGQEPWQNTALVPMWLKTLFSSVHSELPPS